MIIKRALAHSSSLRPSSSSNDMSKLHFPEVAQVACHIPRLLCLQSQCPCSARFWSVRNNGTSGSCLSWSVSLQDLVKSSGLPRNIFSAPTQGNCRSWHELRNIFSYLSSWFVTCALCGLGGTVTTCGDRKAQHCIENQLSNHTGWRSIHVYLIDILG